MTVETVYDIWLLKAQLKLYDGKLTMALSSRTLATPVHKVSTYDKL